MTRVPTALVVLAAACCCAAAAAAGVPTMAQLWPSDDGLAWTYALHHEEYGPAPVTDDQQVRLVFDGTTTAPDGIAAQYLRQQSLGGPAPLAALALAVPDPLLRQVWLARPDLRVRIEQVSAEAPCPQYAPPGRYALLLGGEFAWRRTADEIAAWRCNASNTRAWLWLVADISVGSTFSLPLIPDIANDVVLHGTVAAVEPVSVPAGDYPGSVRVDYVIDYGTSTCTDPGGQPLGTSRSETRGHVHYVPSVGPVESSETFAVVESSGGCEPVGTVALTELRLVTSPVPARTSSWGRIKAAYR